MINVLVTGANGQLGNELRNLSSKNDLFNINNKLINFTFIDVNELDITNKTAVNEYFVKNKFNWIVNCAAYTAVDKAETNEVIAHDVNVKSIINMMDNLGGIEKFISISTDFVFDGLKSTPYSEEDSENPLSVYGKTKLEGERILNSYKNKFLNISIIYSSKLKVLCLN